MWLVKFSSLFVLGFLSLYLGGKSEDGREIAWLQRLGSCDRFHKDWDTRLAAYELFCKHAFEHITLRPFFKRQRRRRSGKEGVATSAEEEALLSDDGIEELVSTASSGARVGELERLIAEKRQGGGWFESGVEEVLAPLGLSSRTTTVNTSELAAWVALPDAMERLREMLVCSEDGSDAASRTAEAIGLIGGDSEYGTGLTEALLARLSGSRPFQVASALFHATPASDEALKLGAHVESLMEMTFGAATNQTFVAIELLVRASRSSENARLILTALRQRGVDARLRQMMLDEEGALARLVAQVAYEVHEPFRLKVHDDALLSDLEWLAGWSAEGLSAVALRPRRSRYCASAWALETLAVYPSEIKAVALHALGDATNDRVSKRLGAATSSHLTGVVYRCIRPFFRADLLDVLYVVENGLGVDLGETVENYAFVARSMMAAAGRSAVNTTNQEEKDLGLLLLPEEIKAKMSLASLFFEEFWSMFVKLGTELFLPFLPWFAFDVLFGVADIAAVRTALLFANALISWLTGGLPVELCGATASAVFVISTLPLVAFTSGVVATAFVCLSALLVAPCLVVHRIVKGYTPTGRHCFLVLRHIAAILIILLNMSLAATMVIPILLVCLVAFRHIADTLILAPACHLNNPMFVVRLVGHASSLGFVAVLASICSFDRVAYYHLWEAFNPITRASASALRRLRRRPVPRKPPTQGLDVCLICHETYGEEQKEDKEFPPPLAFCRWGCGRPFHAECSAAWRQKQNVCALCGATWS